jgi:hypothetical protein
MRAVPGKAPPLRVLLVDDHEVVRSGVSALLQATDEIVVSVRCFEPAARFDRVTRIADVFARPLLRSSAGKAIQELALLSFVGRRSGKHYEAPVEYHELDGEHLILTAAARRPTFAAERTSSWSTRRGASRCAPS